MIRSAPAAGPGPHPATEAAVSSPPAALPWSARVGAVRLLAGAGRLGELGDEARRLGARRVLVVSDPGVARAGWADATLGALAAAGVAGEVWTAIGENPTTAEVEAGAEAAAGRGFDCIAAVGGGSAMDAAKGINLLLTHGGRMADYRGWGKAAGPMLPALAVPTTAGTGSDAQSYALLSDPDTHEKLACGAEGARFRMVILDPLCAATAPLRVVAAAGLDAVAHAVESYVSARGNPVSRMLAGEAWRRLAAHLDGALAAAGERRTGPGDAGDASEPEPVAAWGELLLAAHLAGAAIEQSMLGAAHACANPLTARFGTVHGAAVALMLPAVVRFNAPAAAPLYAELAAAAGLAGDDPAEALAARIEALRAAAALPARLRDAGVDRAALDELAGGAAGQWTAGFNPRPVTADDLRELYAAAW
jgi:alcohol dehydrogenase